MRLVSSVPLLVSIHTSRDVMPRAFFLTTARARDACVTSAGVSTSAHRGSARRQPDFRLRTAAYWIAAVMPIDEERRWVFGRVLRDHTSLLRPGRLIRRNIKLNVMTVPHRIAFDISRSLHERRRKWLITVNVKEIDLLEATDTVEGGKGCWG